MSDIVVSSETRQVGFSERMKTLLEAARQFSQSQIIPKAYQGHPADIFVAIEFGAELGLQPMASLQNIYVVNGRPTLSAQVMAGMVKGRDDYAGMDVESSTTKARVIVRRKLASGAVEEQSGEFTIEQARAANLTGKDNWKSYPQQMLEARAIAFALRKAYPDICAGIYVKEEVQDFEPRNVTHELPPEDAALTDVTDSKGQLSPPSDPGEIKPSGDGTRGAMLEYQKQLNDIACAKYPGTEERILSADDIKDMNAEKHPGGRNLEPTDNDLELLRGIADKYQARVDRMIDLRENGDSAEPEPELF